MATRTETLREGYEAFGKGDVATATDDWSDDFTWEGGSEDMPGGGEHHGKDAALQVLGEAVGAWDSFELHMDQFFEDGDTAVALGHSHVKKGDKEAQLPVVHVWHFDGEKSTRLQVLTDSLQGARLLGLA